MKKIVAISLLGLFLISAQLPNSALKKIEKTFASLWENKSITKEEIKNTENLKISKIFADNQLVGYYALTTANSKADFFDYMVVFNPDLTIIAVQVLVYREDYGGEIGSRRWLQQFVGKKKPEEMKFGHDIQNISGATISARSITNGIQKTTTQITNYKKEGKIL